MTEGYELDPSQNQESALLTDISENMRRTAELVAGHHENTFVLQKLVRVEGIGKFTYSQIGHELEMKFVQQETDRAEQVFEINRGFDISDEGCSPKEADTGFSITIPNPENGGSFTVPVYQQNSDFRLDHEIAAISLDSLAACSSFTAELANAAAAIIQSEK